MERSGSSLRVLLVGQGQPETESLLGQLEALGHESVQCQSGEEAVAILGRIPVDVVVVDVARPQVEGVEVCRKVKELGPDLVPMLLATLRSDHVGRTEGAAAGADGFLIKPVYTDELQSLLRLVRHNFELSTSLRRENRRTTELNNQLLAARVTIDAELQLAHRLQGSLLPQQLPSFPQVQLAAALRPSGPVSGDFYDVFTLDESHLGFYVADAIGHGVPAALLTIFVKKGIVPKEITGKSYRILTPAEVLARLNDDIIAASLSDNPFVTVFYGVLNLDTLRLDYSTGGHPAPMVLRDDGTCESLSVEGPLLGVFQTPFPPGSFDLRAGDSVVVYTDGVDYARGPEGEEGVQWMQALYRAHESLDLPERVRRVLDDLFSRQQAPNDDTTMLALKVLDRP